MKYNVKTDNYKNFEIYKDNILKSRSYFIPFGSREEAEKTDIRDERYNSSRVKILSGEWNFKYYEKVSLMPSEFDTEKESMDTVSVPSMWQFTGYEKPYYLNTRYQFEKNPPNFPEDCSVGVYSRKFELEKKDGILILTFLGVAGSLDVFVNGKYVGYSEGSHNTSEYNITDFTVDGENEIVAVVHKWCNGTYLECQDMFRNNGIFRDVYITETTTNYIYDIDIKTTYNGDGTYMLDLLPKFRLKDLVTLTADIMDGKELVQSKHIYACAEKTDAIAFSVLDVEEWSAENPKLYDLVLTLAHGEKVFEVIRKRIGFKHIEIKDKVFYFNNKSIKLLGVNHHDTNPKTGYFMTVSDMEEDIKLCKEYNVNCIRTSHYPPDPTFLDLCDEYGIYVVDEADIETHGMGKSKSNSAISNNPEWKKHYWDRVSRMYKRDRNHPSITMWSLGNEAGGYKCQDYCYKKLKELSDIPIHYEGVLNTVRKAYDVHSEMYPFHNRTAKFAAGKKMSKKALQKPFYLCEYAHAMGVGAGDLEKYINIFYSSDIMLGGCIWEFADHAVYHKNGKYEYTYGGDHGEEKHDSNFCVDGLFFPDRTPHTGALQMKACYRPIRASWDGQNTFDFKSYLSFKTADYDVNYSVLSNGKEVKSGTIKLNVAPGETAHEFIELEIKDHTVIIFTYLDGDFEVAKEQIELSSYSRKARNTAKEAPSVHESEAKLFIDGKDFNIVYNRKNGEFESYNYKGVELLNSSPLNKAKGFLPELYRAPLDNDKYFNIFWEKKGLYDLSFIKTNYSRKKKGFSLNESSLVIKDIYKLATPKCKNAGTYEVTYSIFGDGTIKFNTQFKKLSFICVPRMGMSFEMPKEFSNVKYYGYDKETLSDFHEHSVYKISNLKVSDMHQKYLKPQESGMRYNTFWAELTNDKKVGFYIEGTDAPFIFNANHYTVAELSRATHKEDLKEYDTTNVHIDGFMMGAGSNSCGPLPTKEHRKFKVKNYDYSFEIRPIG